MSDIWSASCLMGLLCAQLMLTGGPSTLLYSLHHHCYDYRAAYLNPHMIHKTLKNKTLKMIKKAPEQIIPPVIIGYWIFTQRKTKQHILEDSPKTNKTGVLFSHQNHTGTRAKKKRSLTFTHTITLPAPGNTGEARPTQHHQWSMSVSVCKDVCLTGRAEESDQLNLWQPRCMAEIGWLRSDTRHWHKRKCHGSVWWLVHPDYVVVSRRPETKTHMHMKCTQHSTIQWWPHTRILFILFFFYLLSLGELRRTD